MIPYSDMELEALIGDGGPPTVFNLTPLSFRAVMDLNGSFDWKGMGEVGHGTRILKILRYGLDDWDNFHFGPRDDSQEIAFTPQGLEAMTPFLRERLAQRIMEISFFDKEFEEKIRCVVEAAFLKGEAKTPEEKASWDCQTCQAKQLDRARRCPYRYTEQEAEQLGPIEQEDRKYLSVHDKKELAAGKLPRQVAKLSHPYTRCPFGLIGQDGKAIDWYQMVLKCEAAGTTPLGGGMMQQPYLYVQAVDIINAERATIEKARKEMANIQPDPKSIDFIRMAEQGAQSKPTLPPRMGEKERS